MDVPQPMTSLSEGVAHRMFEAAGLGPLEEDVYGLLLERRSLQKTLYRIDQSRSGRHTLEHAGVRQRF